MRGPFSACIECETARIAHKQKNVLSILLFFTNPTRCACAHDAAQHILLRVHYSTQYHIPQASCYIIRPLFFDLLVISINRSHSDPHIAHTCYSSILALIDISRRTYELFMISTMRDNRLLHSLKSYCPSFPESARKQITFCFFSYSFQTQKNISFFSKKLLTTRILCDIISNVEEIWVWRSW